MEPLKLFFLPLAVLLFWTATGSAAAGGPNCVVDADIPGSSYVEGVRRFRDGLEWRFRDRILSPLAEEERLAFRGLSWFPVQPGLAVAAEFIPAEDRAPFAMPTFNGRTLSYSHHGDLLVSIQGRSFRLRAFRPAGPDRYRDFLLVPFRDTTNGDETYPGGRYIEMNLPVPEKPVLDFNRATNPLCAYDPSFACPIPPKSNHMPLAICAGEKRYR